MCLRMLDSGFLPKVFIHTRSNTQLLYPSLYAAADLSTCLSTVCNPACSTQTPAPPSALHPSTCTDNELLSSSSPKTCVNGSIHIGHILGQACCQCPMQGRVPGTSRYSFTEIRSLTACSLKRRGTVSRSQHISQQDRSSNQGLPHILWGDGQAPAAAAPAAVLGWHPGTATPDHSPENAARRTCSAHSPAQIT